MPIQRLTVLIGLAALTACAGALAQSGANVAAGDLLYVEVYRVPEMTQSYLVRQDGTLSLPYVGQVDVGGMNEQAAAQAIAAALEKILRNPRVAVVRSDVGFTSTAGGRTSSMRLEIIPLQNSSAERMASSLAGMSSHGGNISFDGDTNSILITDTPDAIKNMMNAIMRLDQMKSQITQVRIEAKIAEVRVGALKEVGVRFFVQGDNFNAGFNPPPSRILGLNSLTGNFGPLDNELIASNNNSSGGNSAGREFVGDIDRRLSVPVVVPLPGQSFLGFSAGSMDIGALIDALVSDEKAKLLANPTILTVNHKKAVLKMVDEFPFTEFGTEITGAQNFSVKFMELGIVLEVTPHVHRDEIGPYVKLELKPEISFPSGINNGVPIRSVRSSETVANVRDGQTLVIGGIITEDEQNIITKIPGIGNLPIIGALFRHKEKSKFRTELMVFVTPTIFEAPEDVTWDKMINIAKELGKASLIPLDEIRGEARKD